MKVNNETSVSNGNVNAARGVVNTNISNYAMLGKAKRFSWSARRSFRSI